LDAGCQRTPLPKLVSPSTVIFADRGGTKKGAGELTGALELGTRRQSQGVATDETAEVVVVVCGNKSQIQLRKSGIGGQERMVIVEVAVTRLVVVDVAVTDSVVRVDTSVVEMVDSVVVVSVLTVFV
jgi:hypothetical protein